MSFFGRRPALKNSICNHELKMEKKYTIGDWVTVIGLASFYYEKTSDGIYPSRVIGVEKCDPWEGQIIGGTYKPIGVFHPSSSSFGEVYERGYLSVDKMVFVWKVSRGVLNKSVLVTDECVSRLLISNFWNQDSNPPKLPWKWTNHSKE